MATLGLSKVFILDKYFTELQKFWETEKKLQGEYARAATKRVFPKGAGWSGGIQNSQWPATPGPDRLRREDKTRIMAQNRYEIHKWLLLLLLCTNLKTLHLNTRARADESEELVFRT